MITTRKRMQFCMLACKNCNVFASLTKMRMKSERTKTKIKYLKEEKTMREKMEFVEDFFAEDREITVVEFFLALLVAFLFGMVWGMFLSPKGTRVIGSNNGNNNAGYISDRGDDDEDDEE